MVGRPAKHILSFDLENWFDGNLHRAWTYQPERSDGRLQNEMDNVLELLGRFDVKATFFILGTAVQNRPGLVRQIAAAGHEVACHAWSHDLVRDVPPEQYLAGLKRCRALLQDLSGQPVLGHRAPSWSVDRRVPWVVDALLEAGFTYDSSIFPMQTPLYGDSSFPTTPYWLASVNGGRLLELPPAVRRFPLISIPFGGGIYWRILPSWFVRFLMQRTSPPAVTYLHPWELNADPIQFPPDLPLLLRMVLRTGVKQSQAHLEGFLASVPFASFASAIGQLDTVETLPTIVLVGE